MPDSSQLREYARLLRLENVPGTPIALTPQSNLPDLSMTMGAPERSARLVAFCLFVALPVTIVFLYLWAGAADRYTSEARFVLRVPPSQIATAFMRSEGASAVLSSAGISKGAEDGHIVRAFLESRDAMQWLASKAHLKTAVSKAPYDILWRYPGWFENRNAESLYRYFQAIVSVEFDDTTGIGTLRVQGFSPPDAQELASALLDAAEDLVNRLNQRAQQDAVRFAELEVENMRRRADSARQALTAFREREELIDPSLATLAVMETLSKLSLDVSMLNVQLSDLAKASPNSPQFRQLTVRRDALAAEILNQRRQLAGTSESIAPRISQYEKLVLKRDFFDKAFVASLAALHSARIEVNSRHVYLERVVLPNRPDYPSAPWRFVWAAVTLTFFVLVWRLWGIVADDVRRHAVPR